LIFDDDHKPSVDVSERWRWQKTLLSTASPWRFAAVAAQRALPTAEYEEYGKPIARAIHGIQRELISRVVAEHLELEKEMDAKVAKYGRVF
jgi:hypothetical protein